MQARAFDRPPRQACQQHPKRHLFLSFFDCAIFTKYRHEQSSIPCASTSEIVQCLVHCPVASGVSLAIGAARLPCWPPCRCRCSCTASASPLIPAAGTARAKRHHPQWTRLFWPADQSKFTSKVSLIEGRSLRPLRFLLAGFGLRKLAPPILALGQQRRNRVGKQQCCQHQQDGRDRAAQKDREVAARHGE